jgi:mannonate dehydratase
MKMGFRWFGSADDPIPLKYVRQIPGVEQIVWALFDIPAGEVWPVEHIAAQVAEIEAIGLKAEVVESVNVSDAIKIGQPERDRHIANYIESIRNLSKHGVKVICYNFMPIFDWVRTDLRFPLADGSKALAYDATLIFENVEKLLARVQSSADGFMLPGWEAERLVDIRALFEAYAPVDEARLADNFRYFIQAIMPTCEQFDVRMAVHPDDPPWPIFGLPRIVRNAADLRQIEAFHDSPYNGFTLCTGSLGENPDNDVPAIIREFAGRGKAPFVHARNIKHTSPGSFHEAPHLSDEGSLDMFEIMRAVAQSNPDGYLRSDHGRDIWGERGRPGYGLYDRALGVAYLNGLWEAIQKGRG